MKLYLVRHGESECNVQRRLYGRTDCSLTEKGCRQAREVGEKLAGEHIDLCISSPLIRAAETARLALAGRSVRKYTSEAEVIKAATEAGYTDIYKTMLLGVGDLEKRLGRKKFSEVLGKYIVKPLGAPTLVPETDPRKPYSDAAGDFKE